MSPEGLDIRHELRESVAPPPGAESPPLRSGPMRRVVAGTLSGAEGKKADRGERPGSSRLHIGQQGGVLGPETAIGARFIGFIGKRGGIEPRGRRTRSQDGIGQVGRATPRRREVEDPRRAARHPACRQQHPTLDPLVSEQGAEFLSESSRRVAAPQQTADRTSEPPAGGEDPAPEPRVASRDPGSRQPRCQPGGEDGTGAGAGEKAEFPGPGEPAARLDVLEQAGGEQPPAAAPIGSQDERRFRCVRLRRSLGGRAQPRLRRFPAVHSG